MKALHQYDCLRANKATSAWGLEVRVPFLDKEFINVAMGMDPEWKMVLKCLFRPCRRHDLTVSGGGNDCPQLCFCCSWPVF